MGNLIMNLSRLLYYCDFTNFTNSEYQFNSKIKIRNNKIIENKIRNNKIIENNYCILCNSEIRSHFIRDHRGDKDYYWCSNLCYKLYLNRKKNREKRENEQQFDRSNVGP